MEKDNFKGKFALVTGATQGIILFRKKSVIFHTTVKPVTLNT